jgi:hypothetical protein
MFISVANLLRVFDRICQAHFYFTLENVDFGQKMLIQGRRGKWKRLKERHREDERRREERGAKRGKKNNPRGMLTG